MLSTSYFLKVEPPPARTFIVSYIAHKNMVLKYSFKHSKRVWNSAHWLCVRRFQREHSIQNAVINSGVQYRSFGTSSTIYLCIKSGVTRRQIYSDCVVQRIPWDHWCNVFPQRNFTRWIEKICCVLFAGSVSHGISSSSSTTWELKAATTLNGCAL